MPFFSAPVSRRGQRRPSPNKPGPSPTATYGFLLCLALGGIGCSKQTEGERCDLNNFSLDCEDGLVCRGEASLSITGPGVALCCPTLTAPKSEACRAPALLPPEVLPPEVPVPEAGAPDETPPTPLPDSGDSPATPAPVSDAGDGGP